MEANWSGGHRGEILIEARLLPVLGDVLHGRVRQVTDECQIPVPLGRGFFVNAQPPWHPRPLRALAAGDGAFHQVPRLVPTDSQNLGGPADVAFLQHVDREPLKQQSEARVALGPRQAHLPHAVGGTVDPRGPRVQVGHELAGIEMPPRPFRRVVVDRQLRPACRAGPAHTVGVPGPHIDAFFRHRQVDAGHRPRRRQPEDLAVQFDIAHSSHPPRESSCRTARALWKLLAPVDAHNAPTAPWKTLRVFHELPQGTVFIKSPTENPEEPHFLPKISSPSAPASIPMHHPNVRTAA